MNRSTVGRALQALALHGLAQKDAGRCWAGNPAGTDYLAEVAANCGALGRAERRRAKHARERARYASECILRAKRRWRASGASVEL